VSREHIFRYSRILAPELDIFSNIRGFASERGAKTAIIGKYVQAEGVFALSCKQNQHFWLRTPERRSFSPHFPKMKMAGSLNSRSEACSKTACLHGGFKSSPFRHF
jgi:hypothetical protein